MTELRDLLEGVVADADALFLFSPSTGAFERFEDADEPVIVVGPENAVDADEFVELPIDFTDLEGRIRFGIEGALEQDLVEEGDEVVCVTDFLGGTGNTVSRIQTADFTPSGVYDLFVNSRAEPGVVRDVFEVAVELGKKGQKGKPVGALFVVGDAGKVMNKSRPRASTSRRGSARATWPAGPSLATRTRRPSSSRRATGSCGRSKGANSS